MQHNKDTVRDFKNCSPVESSSEACRAVEITRCIHHQPANRIRAVTKSAAETVQDCFHFRLDIQLEHRSHSGDATLPSRPVGVLLQAVEYQAAIGGVRSIRSVLEAPWCGDHVLRVQAEHVAVGMIISAHSGRAIVVGPYARETGSRPASLTLEYPQDR